MFYIFCDWAKIAWEEVRAQLKLRGFNQNTLHGRDQTIQCRFPAIGGTDQWFESFFS